MNEYQLTRPWRNVVRLKAIQRASRHLTLERLAATSYRVRSASHPEHYYYVQIDPAMLTGVCSCLWAHYGGVNCKHVLAVLRAYYAACGELSFWADPKEARRQHRPIIVGTYLYATVRR